MSGLIQLPDPLAAPTPEAIAAIQAQNLARLLGICPGCGRRNQVTTSTPDEAASMTLQHKTGCPVSAEAINQQLAGYGLTLEDLPTKSLPATVLAFTPDAPEGPPPP
jgi:hypothetical protein